MGGFIIGILTIFVLVYLKPCDGMNVNIVNSCSSPVKMNTSISCSRENALCEFTEDSLIDAVMHVPSLEDCRQKCLNDENCQHISYFNDNAQPVKHLCRLLKSCEKRILYKNCVSEGRECFEDCGNSIAGVLDGNVLDLVTNIESREECKQLCVNWFIGLLVNLHDQTGYTTNNCLVSCRISS